MPPSMTKPLGPFHTTTNEDHDLSGSFLLQYM
jgi:hypothetical protein